MGIFSKAEGQTAEYLNGVLDTMAEGVYLFDKNGILFHINSAVEKSLGFERGSLIGRDFRDPFPPRATLNGCSFPNLDSPYLQAKNAGRTVFGIEYKDNMAGNRPVCLCQKAKHPGGSPWREEST
jgi:PAS domain-containing protein